MILYFLATTALFNCAVAIIFSTKLIIVFLFQWMYLVRLLGSDTYSMAKVLIGFGRACTRP